jgi:hypothetical protein
MKMHKAKRVEIIIEAVMERRLTNALVEAGVTGYSQRRLGALRTMVP